MQNVSLLSSTESNIYMKTIKQKIIREKKHPKYLEDIVHPCVRYIKEKFRGYHWWMVYTPYFKHKNELENPILCYANENEAGDPIEWVIYKNVRDYPGQGYNSDPSLFFEDNTLYVVWRECFTNRVLASGHSFAIYGCRLEECGDFIYLDEPLICSKYHFHDSCLSPNIIRENSKYRIYGVDFRLRSKWTFINNLLEKRFFIYLNILATRLGFPLVRRHLTISSWSSENILTGYVRTKNHKIVNGKTRYQYWHLDCFEKGGSIFFIIQSNENIPDILIGKKESENIELIKEPLLLGKNLKYMYKPSAVYRDGVLYVFYTVLENEYNQLYYVNFNF